MGIWGYLVHFKATGMLLLLVDSSSVHAVSAIAKHPVCHYMQQQPSRCGLNHQPETDVTCLDSVVHHAMDWLDYPPA